jgi:hypothetical protein
MLHPILNRAPFDKNSGSVASSSTCSQKIKLLKHPLPEQRVS